MDRHNAASDELVGGTDACHLCRCSRRRGTGAVAEAKRVRVVGGVGVDTVYDVPAAALHAILVVHKQHRVVDVEDGGAPGCRSQRAVAGLCAETVDVQREIGGAGDHAVTQPHTHAVPQIRDADHRSGHDRCGAGAVQLAHRNGSRSVGVTSRGELPGDCGVLCRVNRVLSSRRAIGRRDGLERGVCFAETRLHGLREVRGRDAAGGLAVGSLGVQRRLYHFVLDRVCTVRRERVISRDAVWLVVEFVVIVLLDYAVYIKAFDAQQLSPHCRTNVQ